MSCSNETWGDELLAALAAILMIIVVLFCIFGHSPHKKYGFNYDWKSPRYTEVGSRFADWR